MTDALTLLKNDHKKVETLFRRYEETTDRAVKTRQSIVDTIIEELSVHAAIEEQCLYPVSRAISDDLQDDTLEALEEHHVAKLVLQELSKLQPTDERFHPKVTVLIENVRHHVEEEETELFPKLREALTRTQLTELGDALIDAKATAPTRPHPGAPDQPPGNIVVGVVNGVVDRVRDVVGAVLP